MSLSGPQWPLEKLALSPPTLDQLALSIHDGLQSNFRSVTVEVAQSPDLRQPPFHLAAEGLSGNPRVADVGGPLFLAPGPDFSKKYNLLSIAKQMEMPSDRGFILGAGAGPFHILGVNSELMPNVSFGAAACRGEEVANEDKLSNQTYYAKIAENDSYTCEEINGSHQTTDFALMANLLGTDGLPGPLLHIKAKSRLGSLNFTEAIQHALKATYGKKLISLGGVFVIRSGAAKMHVMPDFPPEPFAKREDVAAWLKFFDMPAPLVCLTVIHSGDDHGLSLRMEHTHCFAPGGGRGGHYHGDADDTKDDVEYEAWLNVAEVLYRIDRPGLVEVTVQYDFQ